MRPIRLVCAVYKLFLLMALGVLCLLATSYYLTHHSVLKEVMMPDEEAVSSEEVVVSTRPITALVSGPQVTNSEPELKTDTVDSSLVADGNGQLVDVGSSLRNSEAHEFMKLPTPRAYSDSVARLSTARLGPPEQVGSLSVRAALPSADTATAQSSRSSTRQSAHDIKGVAGLRDAHMQAIAIAKPKSSATDAGRSADTLTKSRVFLRSTVAPPPFRTSSPSNPSSTASLSPPLPPASSTSPFLSQSHPALSSIRPGFTWPQPRALRPVHELLGSQWMTDLLVILSSLPSRQLTLVTSNQAYTEVLLNWLAVAAARASLDVSQVLVLSLDHHLFSLLREKHVNTVLLTRDSFLPGVLREGVFPVVMMARLAMIRLLNHLGYDVYNYDTDAVLLRDPSEVLAHSTGANIVGTFGKFPTDLHNKWGITLCTALLVVRSSPQTEDFWRATSAAKLSSYSDQGKMNYGLEALGIQWSLPHHKLSSLTTEVKGQCSNGLRVSLLPYNIACRASSCHRKDLPHLLLWHKGGDRAGETKKKGAEDGGVWVLHSQWANMGDRLTGKEWLLCISNKPSF